MHIRDVGMFFARYDFFAVLKHKNCDLERDK